MKHRTVAFRWYKSSFDKNKDFVLLVKSVLKSRGYSIDFIEHANGEDMSWSDILKKYNNIITWDGVNYHKNISKSHNILYFHPHRFHRFSGKRSKLLYFFDNDGFHEKCSISKSCHRKLKENKLLSMEPKLINLFGDRKFFIKEEKENKLLFMMHLTRKYWDNSTQKILDKIIKDCKEKEIEILIRPHPLSKWKKSYKEFVEKTLKFSKNNMGIKISTSEMDIKKCKYAVTLSSTSILAPAYFGAKCCSVTGSIFGDCDIVHNFNKVFYKDNVNIIEELDSRDYSYRNLLKFTYFMYVNTNKKGMTNFELLEIPSIRNWIEKIIATADPKEHNKKLKTIQLHI